MPVKTFGGDYTTTVRRVTSDIYVFETPYEADVILSGSDVRQRFRIQRLTGGSVGGSYPFSFR